VVTPAIVNKNEQPPTISVSGSFRLRPLRIEDAPALFAYLCDPRVLEHTSFPLFDMAGVRRIIEWQIAGYADATSRRWALADDADALIATCGFSNWSLDHWGRGLMLVSAHAVVDWAFSDAGFNRVHAFVMTTNEPSIKLLEHCGFLREGTLRQYRIARGAPRDFHLYALLRQDGTA
jgi:ribosomal-protein-alanine N-acetyltransferase